jgi:uncharacterized protein YndB with AHSA1/START domain
MKNEITVKVSINSDIETVWYKFTNPSDITNWYIASMDWHTPIAINNLVIGKQFLYRMEAKDGRFGFDLIGTYTNIYHLKTIHFTLEDDRKVEIDFEIIDNQIVLTEKFEPETENPLEMQQFGWQSILDNFKKYVETV